MFSTSAIKEFAKKAREGEVDGNPASGDESENILPAGMTKVRSKYAGAGG